MFLSLFDDNPAVGRAFCPPKSAYTEPPKAGQKHGTPLPPLDQLLESGKVLALNFPVGLNPGLARALGVMLKLDFQRAVLSRISRRSPPHRNGRGAISCSSATSTTRSRRLETQTRLATNAPSH